MGGVLIRLHLLLLFICGSLSVRCRCGIRSSLFCTSKGLRHVPQNITCWRGVTEGGNRNGFSRRFYLKYFRTIDLSHNSISLHNSGVFKRSSSATTLDLSDNNIQWLEGRVFEGLRRLTILNLSNNYIESLQSNTFANLTMLDQLLLSGNQISLLPPLIFNQLRNLTVLKLDANSIKSIQFRVLHVLSNLRVLDLAHNRLKNLDKHAFEELYALQTLNLSSNGIQRIDHEQNRKVKCDLKVDLSFGAEGHAVSECESSFDAMIRLRELDLTNNSLLVLNAETFTCLDHLSKLHLGGNPFKCKNCRVKKFKRQVCERHQLCVDDMSCRGGKRNHDRIRKVEKNKNENGNGDEGKGRRLSTEVSQITPTTAITTTTKRLPSTVSLHTTTNDENPAATPSSAPRTRPKNSSKQLPEAEKAKVQKVSSSSSDVEIVLWLIVSSVIAGISAILVCITIIAFCSKYNRGLEEAQKSSISGASELKRESLSSLGFNHLALRPLPEEPKTDVESVVDGASLCGDRGEVHVKWLTKGSFSLQGRFSRNDDLPPSPPPFPAALLAGNEFRRSSSSQRNGGVPQPLPDPPSYSDKQSLERKK